MTSTKTIFYGLKRLVANIAEKKFLKYKPLKVGLNISAPIRFCQNFCSNNNNIVRLRVKNELIFCNFAFSTKLSLKFLHFSSDVRRNSSGKRGCKLKTITKQAIGQKFFQIRISNKINPILLFKALCICISFFA